ncbi:MAG: hypothetical protein ACLQK4_13640 [Acidimicrobiales bacterium]
MDQSRARIHRTQVGSFAGLAVVASLCLGACSSGAGSAGSSSSTSAAQAGSGSSVVTPEAARALVAPTMTTNNKANASLSSSLLASYEAGSAYSLDNATYEADRLAKRQTHHAPPYSPFTIELKALGLVRQTAWPADFVTVGLTSPLAKTSPKTPSCGSLFEFERTSASGRWRIVLEPEISGTALPALAVGAGGYSPRPSGATERAAAALPSEVSAALLAEETSGKLGPFKSSDFTGACWQLPNPRGDIVYAEANGFGQRDLYSTITPRDTAAFALNGGGALVVFTLRFDDQLIASSSSRPVTWTQVSLSKYPGAAWMYFLAAGLYSQVTEKGEIQVAVDLAPGGKHYSVVGSYSGITSVTGTKTKSSGPPPSGTLTSFRR